MDIDKARRAHFLYGRRDELKASVLTMRSRYEKASAGTTNLTVPTSWLPELISLAERELENIDSEIARL